MSIAFGVRKTEIHCCIPNCVSGCGRILGGIARENKMKAIAVGGAADHVHVVLSLPATLSVAKMVQLLKGNSSKWIHEAFSECVRLNGRKVTARSVLVSLLLMRPERIFETKLNTIVVELFARNLRQYYE